MRPLVLALPGNEVLAGLLVEKLDADAGHVEFRRFPDGESYVRLDSEIAGRSVVLVSTLDRPDPKFLPLAFVAATARELGATRVGLIAPYLAYMRQDRRFHPGEAITSRIFADQLSVIVDWLVAVDPHLHRISALSEIYRIPAMAVHSSPSIALWIKDSVTSPVLIGPDEESAQWVSAVADGAGAPFVILEKHRRGDADVEISIPNVERWRNHTPVLVDDIISTGRTMIETIEHLHRGGMKPAVCIGVHAVFAAGTLEAVRAAGIARIVTTNTIGHETNAIDITLALGEAVDAFIR
ncbi:MAG TPA: ribose-phosphate pyrophosphokinase [Micropepsaceae bacterium]|nr:ribose-phosphate pyrophosphokinase [Micropepsaceae bacterium]